MVVFLLRVSKFEATVCVKPAKMAGIDSNPLCVLDVRYFDGAVSDVVQPDHRELAEYRHKVAKATEVENKIRGQIQFT